MYEDKYDTRDNNLLVLYLQTVVITARPGVTTYLNQVNNILTVTNEYMKDHTLELWRNI